MPESFRVRVVTPERELLATEAKLVVFPAFDGEMGILPRRAALLAQLGAGMLRIEEAAGGRRTLFVAGGFVQMVDDQLTLLTEEARESTALTAEEARMSLEAAAALPTRSAAEQGQRERALARALAMGRLARS